MATELQQAKRLAFWQMFGGGVLIVFALLLLGLAQEAMIHFFFY